MESSGKNFLRVNTQDYVPQVAAELDNVHSSLGSTVLQA